MGVLQKLKSKLMHPELFHISMYVTSDIKAHKTNKVRIVHSCIIGLPATIGINSRFIIWSLRIQEWCLIQIEH